MNSIILFRTALQSIKKHRIRSFLTILGIMMGIAAMMVTFSIGSGAEEKIRHQILSMGENAIFIIAGNIIERGAVRSSLSNPPKLRLRDLESIRKQAPDVIEISRGHDSLQAVEHNGHTAMDRVYGSDENMLKINKNKMLYGSYFSDFHVKHRVNVAVLGKELAEKLFPNEYPIHQTILIDKHPFTVIGVMDYIDYFFGIHNPNMRTFIPFTVARKYFGKKEEVDDQLQFIALSVNPDKETDETLRIVKRVLRLNHNIDEGNPDDFTIFDQDSIANSASKASAVITLFGLIAASIALLVGGIGVMNIMLVSVRERTKEIGIRLALGATQWAIQLQFLIEAVILSSIGGLLGIFLGILAQYGISAISKLPNNLAIIPMLFSIIVTILVGVFFGFYPARKASHLNPVDALYER